MNFLNSGIGDNLDDEPASWVGNLLLAVAAVALASSVYFLFR